MAKEIFHSFDYWSKNGYLIKKGSKSVGRNKLGKPLFSNKQITKKYKLKPLSIFENDDPRDDGYWPEDNGLFGGDPMDYGNS